MYIDSTDIHTCMHLHSDLIPPTIASPSSFITSVIRYRLCIVPQTSSTVGPRYTFTLDDRKSESLPDILKRQRDKLLTQELYTLDTDVRDNCNSDKRFVGSDGSSVPAGEGETSFSCGFDMLVIGT